MPPSSLARHTVPPVYVCYSLRSLSKPNQTYVGSTTDPARRLRQHNGETKQGAFFTRLARPWVMDMLVYGFPSKLAALQFEWSWQSPHVSRHMRQVARSGGTPSSSAGRGAPLYPPTRKKYFVSPRTGRARIMARTSSVPEMRMLVLRALLASEPFCFWGLRVAFFSEFAYGMWRYLETEWERHRGVPRWRSARITERPLPENYPRIVCAFHGADGQRAPLEQGENETHPVLPEADVLTADQKRMRSPRKRRTRGEEHVPTFWEEPMPPSRNAQELGLRWADLAEAPRAPAAEPSGARRRSVRPPFLEEHSGAVERALMQRRVAERLPAKASQALVARTFAEEEPKCALCHGPVHLPDAYSYSLCPSAEQDEHGTVHACDNVYHLECLARHFVASESATPRRFCLPVAGRCPSSSCATRPQVTWNEVVRRVFRRASLLGADDR